MNDGRGKDMHPKTSGATLSEDKKNYTFVHSKQRYIHRQREIFFITCYIGCILYTEISLLIHPKLQRCQKDLIKNFELMHLLELLDPPKVAVTVVTIGMILVWALKVKSFYNDYASLFELTDSTIPPGVPRFFDDENESPLNSCNTPKTPIKRTDGMGGKRFEATLNAIFIILGMFNFVTRYLFCDNSVAPVYFLLVPVMVALSPSKRKDIEIIMFLMFILTSAILLFLKPIIPHFHRLLHSDTLDLYNDIAEILHTSLCSEDVHLLVVTGIPLITFLAVMLYHNHVVKLDSNMNERRYRQYSILLETVIANLPTTLWTVDRDLNITFSRGDRLSEEDQVTPLTEKIGVPLKNYVTEHLQVLNGQRDELIQMHDDAINQGVIVTNTYSSKKPHLRQKSITKNVDDLSSTTSSSSDDQKSNLSNQQHHHHERADSKSHFSTVIAPWTKKNGYRIGAVGLSYDISEFVRAREALQKSEDNYKSMISSLQEPIVRINSKMIVSLATKPLFKKRPGQLIGKSILDVLHASSPENREHSKQNITKVFKNQKENTWEWEDDRKIYSVTATFMNDDIVEDGYATLIIRDVTEQRNSQKNMLLAREAKIASRSKSAFIASMSHEVRNPLQAIMGSLQLMSTTCMSTTQMEYIDDATENAKLLLAIISDVLDMSKIESGKLELIQAPFSIMDVVETTSDMLSLQAYEKNIEIITNIDTRLPTQLIGDKTRISQILTNLTSNAIKFTKQGCVTLGVDLIRESESAVTLQLSCQDTGVGIKQQDIKRLFQPFVQLKYDNVMGGEISSSSCESKNNNSGDEVTVDVNESVGESHHCYKGWGLGLHICDRLVRLMNGHIQVESEFKKGSKFIVTITLDKIGDHTHQENAIIHLVQSSSPTNHTSCQRCKIQSNLYSSKFDTVIIVNRVDPLSNVIQKYCKKLNVQNVIIVNDAERIIPTVDEYVDPSQPTPCTPTSTTTVTPPSSSTTTNDHSSEHCVAIIVDGLDTPSLEKCDSLSERSQCKVIVLVSNKQHDIFNAQNYRWTENPSSSSNSDNLNRLNQHVQSKDLMNQHHATLQAVINKPNVIVMKKPIKLRRLMATLSGRKSSYLSSLIWNMDMNNTTISSMIQNDEKSEPPSKIETKEKEQEEYVKETPSVDIRDYKLMLVEDNPINQKLLQRLLNKIGYGRVEIADNGLEAIKKIDSQQEPFDLILMDLQMPQMNGFDCTIAIRERKDQHKDTPIVAITANAFSESMQKCIKVGMNHVLIKPVNITNLITTVQNYAKK
ncbi:gacS [Acrasis kona]|uniref:GacS n=1 Tax=Acrasis kona TaxID=1008807 RepID=A0AAW2Z4V6_9EUKA